jgi:archaetidylinositol phosphate synthase
VLDRHRSRLDWWLVPLAKSLRHVNPNVFTWVSLGAALFGGYAFYRSAPDALAWLLVGWAMVLANSVLDLLDGKVAKMTGKATPRGDRFSDVAFLLGLALSAWVRVEIGMLALVFTLLTSYLGTQGQAVGIGRNYGGMLGRADRMVLLLILPLIEYALWRDGSWHFYQPFARLGVDAAFSGLELMLLYFAVVGAITTVQRFRDGLRGFDRQGQLKRREP